MDKRSSGQILRDSRLLLAERSRKLRRERSLLIERGQFAQAALLSAKCEELAMIRAIILHGKDDAAIARANAARKRQVEARRTARSVQ